MSPGAIGYDVHCHLLPDVDDGARNIEESISGVETLQTLGYQGTVFTPHIYREVFNNDEAFLRDRFEAFKHEAGDRLGEFQLQLGAEYLLDDQFLDKLYDHSDQLLTFGAADGSRKLLIEFSGIIEPFNAVELIDECRRQGIEPIIAHIERYAFVVDDRVHRRAQEWREHGALLQINVGSLAGQYGPMIQRTARNLWHESFVDLLGTDLHRPYGTRRFLNKGWEYIQKKPNTFDPQRQRRVFEPAA